MSQSRFVPIISLLSASLGWQTQATRADGELIINNVLALAQHTHQDCDASERLGNDYGMHTKYHGLGQRGYSQQSDGSQRHQNGHGRGRSIWQCPIRPKYSASAWHKR